MSAAAACGLACTGRTLWPMPGTSTRRQFLRRAVCIQAAFMACRALPDRLVIRRGGASPEKRPNSTEGRDAGLRATENQRMNVVRALVGIDRFEVHYMADHMELVGDAVAAVHVAGRARDIQRLAA